MIDLQITQDSLLCKWLIELSDENNNAKWTWIPRLLFSDLGKDLACFNTSVGFAEFKGLDSISSSFRKQVAQTWLIIIRTTTKTPIKEASLWNNLDILCQGNVIYFKNLVCKGITRVRDIVDENGLPLPLCTMKDRVGASPDFYLQYIAIRNAVNILLNAYPFVNEIESDGSSRLLCFNNVFINKASDIRILLAKSKLNKSQSDMGIFSHFIFTFESPKQTLNYSRLFVLYG